MTKYIFTTLLLINLTLVLGQTPNFQWAKKWNTYSAFDIATDEQGNVYTLSTGSTQVNFNPSGTVIMGPTAGCGAISKFDSNGNLIWVKFITQTGATNGSCDPKRLFIKGNYLYYAGEFGDGGGTYDFNLSNTATYNIYGGCNGCGIQVFVSKIDLDGNFQWMTRFGSYATVNDIYVDNADNVLITGGFKNDITLNGQNTISNGDRDAYFMKLNSLGTCEWVRSIGSSDSFTPGEMGVNVKVNSLGEIIVVGNFEGTVDIDPGSNVVSISSVGSDEAFILKLNSAGILIDHKVISGTGTQRIEGLEINENDEVILTGIFSDSTDFNLGTGIYNLYHNIGTTFLAKYSNQFNLIWAKQINGATVRTMNTDQNQILYLSGVFSGTVDFDPSPNLNQETSGYGSNTFILKLSNQGDYLWSGIIETGPYNQNFNNQWNEPQNIFAKPDGIYISGNFAAPTDFDPGAAVFTMTSMTSPNGYQQNATAFILKLSQCPATSSNLAVSSCGSFSAPDGQVYNQSGQYTSVLTNAAGCDSVVTINLTINQSSTSAITTTSCGTYLSPAGNSYTVSGVYTDTLSTNSGCDSTVTINLTINTVDTTVVKNGSTLTANQNGASYQWYNCTTNQQITGASSQSYTATSPGWYAVMITINGCSQLSACRQIKKVSLPNPPMNGTAELDEDQLNNVLIYPNPTNDQINIEFEGQNEWEVELIDLSGRQVFKLINEQVIDLSNIKSGVYRVVVRTKEFQYQQALVKL